VGAPWRTASDLASVLQFLISSCVPPIHTEPTDGHAYTPGEGESNRRLYPELHPMAEVHPQPVILARIPTLALQHPSVQYDKTYTVSGAPGVHVIVYMTTKAE